MTRLQRAGWLAVAVVAAVVALAKHWVKEDDVLIFTALVVSVVLHEATHALVAYAFGDDTAMRAGRVSLNPLAHVDPFGTIILPALLILSTGAAFGYARPVPVNQRRMRSPRNQGMLTALAGPGTNIALAVLAAVLLRLTFTGDTLPARFLYALGLVNVILAVFNLLPVPPLDGSAVIERLLPARLWPRYLRIRQYSMGLVLVLVLLVPLNRVFDPAIDLWRSFL